MNTPAKQPYKIKARHIGPIMELDGELSNKDQNLIFARNGTGKSFLSRAFRYIAEYKNPDNLDSTDSQENLHSLAELLVSKESVNLGDGSAEFIFSQDTTQLAKLEINPQNPNPNPYIDPETIFHVFSQDFVEKELGKPKYELDLKKITEEIPVGRKNIELETAIEEHNKTKTSYANEMSSLTNIFNKEKETELKNKTGIYATLAEYRDLSIESCFTRSQQSETPTTGISLSEIIKDLDNLKSAPIEQPLPKELEPLSLNEIPLVEIQTILEKLISPSEIAKEVIEKINKNPNFYKYGISLIDKNPEVCPLCDQSLENERIKNIINKYVEYFSEEEATVKEELIKFCEVIELTIKKVHKNKNYYLEQANLFNDLKKYFPLKKDTTLQNTTENNDEIINLLQQIKEVIHLKESDLSNRHDVPEDIFDESLESFNKKIMHNNEEVKDIIKKYNNQKEVRLPLQRDACKAFSIWFAEKYNGKIGDIQSIEEKIKEQIDKIKKLESTGDKISIRDKVASTFQDLLSHFFGNKYSFNKENNAIKLNDEAMPPRGNNETLSDGEKSVLAFCYFIAVIHQKIQNKRDYKKLFLVFDDPVTSMSYDFVFSVVQALRNLGISKEGDISIKYRQPKEGHDQPRLLVLTHNSYFFNIAFSKGKGIVKSKSAFLLDKTDNNKHNLSDMSEYIAPFKYQLIDIIAVVNGKDPDHTTANSIRSVLEAIQKFCHPDKELQNFLEDIARDNDININSTLINTLSHGLYDGTMPPIPDLKKVCEDVEKIAEIFIPGQVKKIKANNH